MSNPNSAAEAAKVRSGRELFEATKPFAVESPARSWFHLITTLTLVVAALVLAGLDTHLLFRIPMSILAGFVLVRGFILYHDHAHGALLRKSKLAHAILWVYGGYTLNPYSVWKSTHNAHHAETLKVGGHGIGSFPVMTTTAWRKASYLTRLSYTISRHPLAMLLAYVTVFLFSMTIEPFLRNQRRHWDSIAALVIHFGIGAAIWLLWGFWAVFFAQIVPYAVSAAAGAYLFYAQHNFPGVKVFSKEEWTFERAALESSSFMKLNPILTFLTGNIGYHHIHHLNHMIPFYRLPEAMAAIPELQNAVQTSLKPADIVACLNQNLWDEETQTMKKYSEVPSNHRRWVFFIPLPRRTGI